MTLDSSTDYEIRGNKYFELIDSDGETYMATNDSDGSRYYVPITDGVIGDGGLSCVFKKKQKNMFFWLLFF